MKKLLFFKEQLSTGSWKLLTMNRKENTLSVEDYNNKLETIQAIPEDQVKSPAMPVDHYLQEAENLHSWSQKDKDDLIANGLDWRFAEELPVRTGALRQAQSIWFKERYGHEKAQRVWNEKSPAAYELRDSLLHSMRYAYRKQPELLQRVSEIADGNGHVDMIQDLNDIAVLGKANPEPLTAINKDLAELDRAAQTANEMAELMGDVSGERKSSRAARVIRDKAYTYLKEAVDEVRACGQYVFWKNESRLKGYASEYTHRHRGKGKDEANQPDVSDID